MVRGAVERNAGLQHSPQRVGQLRSRRIQDGRVIEAGGARRRRRAAKALPGVQPDVVVVAAGGEERRARAVPLRQLEPEDVAVKPERPFEVGDLQMDVTDPDAGVNGGIATPPPPRRPRGA